MKPITRTCLGTLTTAVALAAVTACGAQPAAPAAAPPVHQAQAPAAVQPVADAAVTIANYAFSPAALTVPVGTTVTWTNTDSVPHDVSGGPLHSPILNQGQSWSYTFSTAGTYSYICSIHPYMNGSVTVT
ncbi:cupredoxin domain-containing protein [Pseudonocardia acidicola]|uniref:Cupredoxin family copper-binding protein n=1 Tax=Pseudonocardia acidicola TaxID=2724939 RepID=A0ABX1SG63_9PSEU|nr:cupredoxin family copper-binding protein [Pseudonocardia acidicola]NMH99376.1 cupredoxin family copper-binding protein [Pseudonocardia acidicola]